MQNRVHIIGKNEAVKRMIEDRLRSEFDRIDRTIQFYLGTALICGAAFLIWLGWLLGQWISSWGKMP